MIMKEVTLDELIEEVQQTEHKTMESMKTDEMIMNTATAVIEAVKNNSKIVILTDYDADGITSAYIMDKLIKSIDTKVSVEVKCNDRRGSYGLSEDLKKDDSSAQYIICDMGCNQLSFAKERLGDNVIIIDHHLFNDNEAKEEFAKAENMTLCNPHALNDDDSKNAQYCTAGLAYRIYQNVKELSETMGLNFKTDVKQENTITALACIGTATDMVNVLDTNSYNRKILKEGVKVIDNADEKNFDYVLGYILSKLNVEDRVTAHQLAFGVGSFLNSASRMSEIAGENGAQRMYNALTANPDSLDTYSEIDKLLKQNNERKDIVNKLSSSEEYKNFVKEQSFGAKAEDNIAIYRLPDNTPSAFAGLMANKLAEATDKAIICFIYNEKTKSYSGSGRNVQSNKTSLKEFIDKALSKGSEELEITYGGHENAVGISHLNDIGLFETLIQKSMNEMQAKDLSERRILTILGDVDSKETLEKLYSIEPVGTGLKIPPVLIAGKVSSTSFLKGRDDWNKMSVTTESGIKHNISDWSYSEEKYPADTNGKIETLVEIGIRGYKGQHIELAAKTDRAFISEAREKNTKDKEKSITDDKDNDALNFSYPEDY